MKKGGERRRRAAGYLLLSVLVVVLILSIFLLAAVPLWNSEVQREREEELLFRARQYVRAIGFYLKAHNNLYPQNLEVLYQEKFLRQPYPDPLSADGRWDLVYQALGSRKLLIVAGEQAARFQARGVLIGVCCTCPDTGFREYRGKKHYNEWAFYLGENENEEMPEMEYVGGQ